MSISTYAPVELGIYNDSFISISISYKFFLSYRLSLSYRSGNLELGFSIIMDNIENASNFKVPGMYG